MKISDLFDTNKRNRKLQALAALGAIIVAVLLIEVITLLQYRYIHHTMENELDYQNESELEGCAREKYAQLPRANGEKLLLACTTSN